jgi:predicted nucleotidyltransferase
LSRAGPDAARIYEDLLERARRDPAVLAFWLGGSRGTGRPTEWSDYDIGIIVAEEAYAGFRRELGLEEPFQADWRPGVDLVVRTFPMFEAFAAWDSDERGYRYMFAHLEALVDKTGRAQPLIDAKARVPAGAVAPFVRASLDHALNQTYRALKCRRDGDLVASRLEAAEAVAPFLDAAFAIHDRRLRPYYKYLAWELETWPLSKLSLDGAALLDRLQAVLDTSAAAALARLIAETMAAFRAEGHGEAYDGWGGAMGWMLEQAP